mmetsp:Transcript_25115/g.71590  ORF Transcript_25115/g.71590 Transcript_25115/m.71590 type:complete len:221 (-) Transcript_25115:264-926(-)
MRSMWPLALTKLPSARLAVPSTPFQRRASNKRSMRSLALPCTCQASVKQEKNMASARKATMLLRCGVEATPLALARSRSSSWSTPSARPKLSNMTGSVLVNWSVEPVKICFRNATRGSSKAGSFKRNELLRHWNIPFTSGCTLISLLTLLTSATANIAFQAAALELPTRRRPVNSWPRVLVMFFTETSDSCSVSSSTGSTCSRAARKGGSAPTRATRRSA